MRNLSLLRLNEITLAVALIKQTGLDHQVFQITEGIPNSGNKAAME